MKKILALALLATASYFTVYGFDPDTEKTAETVSVVSPDGKKKVVDSKLIDVETGKELADFSGITHPTVMLGSKEVTTGKELKNEPVISAAFSPDGNKVVILKEDGAISIWDANSGELLQIVKKHPFSKAVRFTDDGEDLILSYEITSHCKHCK